MNVVAWHPEDLIDKRLAGELTENEHAELDAHLAECVACRFEALVVDDLAFDEEEVEASPELAKLVRAAVEPGPPASRRRRIGPGLIVGAAILIAGSAAALYRIAQPPPPPPSPAPAVQAVTTVDDAPTAAPIAPQGPRAEPQEEEEPPAPPKASAAPATAASLFSRANAARRAGKRKLALALYQQLQSKFPESREAKLSKATIGRMMLDEDPERALESYDGYLEGGDGAVSEEALVGRATALQRMGKAQEERQAWLELLSRYPDSIHAGRAKARLAELSSSK